MQPASTTVYPPHIDYYSNIPVSLAGGGRNISTNIHIPQGGIGVTFVVNCALSAIYIAVFLLFCQRLTLFNVNKKRRLLKMYEKYKKQWNNAQQAESHLYQNEASSSSAPPVQPVINPESDTMNDSELELMSSGSTWDSIKYFFNFVWEMSLTLIPFTNKQKMDTKQIMRVYGRNVATYFKFLQLIIYLTAIICAVCLVIILPIHATGTPPVYEYENNFGSFNLTQEDSGLLRTSVIMVMDSPLKLYIHLLLALLFALLILIMLYRFIHSDELLEQYFVGKSASLNNLSSHPLVSPLTIAIDNLPKTMTSKKKFQSMVEKVFNDNISLNDQSHSKIAKAVLVLDIKQRLDLQQKLDKINEELEHFIYVANTPSLLQYFQKKAVVIPELAELRERPFFFQPIDAIDYYSKAKTKVEQHIAEWEEEYKKAIDTDTRKQADADGNIQVIVHDSSKEHSPLSFLSKKGIYGSGCGFIIFKTQDYAKECMDKYRNRGIWIKKDDNSILSIDNSISSYSPISTNRDAYCITVQNIEYEPSDVNWKVVCRRAKFLKRKHERNMNNLALHLGLICFFFFFSTPLSVWSAIQSMFNRGVIQITTSSVKNLTGPFGNLLFQFLPSFCLYLCSYFYSSIISVVISWQHYSSKSKYKRTGLVWKFAYLIMATLILPSLLLMTLDGIIIYVKDRYSIKNALTKMFLPASGAFFINYILQNAILANTDNLLRVEDTLIYIWKTRINVYRKPLTPAEKLKAASLIDFRFESEYARILSVVTIGLSFSLFSPIISICTVLYLFIKYYVDRYQVEYLYSHQIEMKNFYEENEEEEMKSVFDSDFLSHLRLIELLTKLVTVVVSIFLSVVFIFYATKANDVSYLPHTLFSLLLLIMSVACCLYLHYSNEGHFILSFAKYEILNLCEPVENMPPVERTILGKAYEYEHSFKFMRESPEVKQESDAIEEAENVHF